MREADLEKVRRRLLREAVAENLDTMRGLPPRAIRTPVRIGRLFLRRLPLVLIPLLLAGSTWIVTGELRAGRTSATPQLAAALPARTLQPRTHSPHVYAPATLDPTVPLAAVDASVFPLAVHRVVLDAGHGGNDPGTSAATRLTEKEVTLDIQRRLRDLLERNGFEVILTRPDDRFIALRERARLANSSSSDVFVSIHVNSILNPDRHGVETYFLGAANDAALAHLATTENAGSGYSMTDLRKLLDGVYADARRDESRRLAASVQEKLFDGLRADDPGLQNWGVKRAPFVVLIATEMPAVLAEVGCLSNPKEAEMLAQQEYRQKIAQSLFTGIRAYATATEAPQKKGI
jgi:N-acetylmuramoyl-L-alanine amidase